MKIDKKGRRLLVRVKLDSGQTASHRVILGNTLEEVWANKDHRPATFETNGADSWVAKSTSGETIGWIQLEPVAATRQPRYTGRSR